MSGGDELDLTPDSNLPEDESERAARDFLHDLGRYLRGEELEGIPGETAEPPPQAAGRSLGVPEHLGSYEVLGRIGSGGMGTVYEARDSVLGRRVALKVIRRSQGTVERFEREARALAKLKHPAIVELYEFGEDKGLPFISMEYLDGEELGAVLQQKMAGTVASDRSTAIVREWGTPLPGEDSESVPPEIQEGDAEASEPRRLDGEWVRTVLEWMRDAARGLEHGHSLGVLHRDIKPSNLLVTREGKIKIMDFGLARDLKDVTVTRTGDFLGTPRYMSPEQLLTRRIGIDHRTDVYSLGVTLYELLAGEYPFPYDSQRELYRKIALEEPEPLREKAPWVSRDLETVVLVAMAKHPGHRYQSAAAFADDLDAVLEDRPIRARRPGLVRRLRLQLRRSRGWLVPAAAGLLVAVVLVGLWAHWSSRDSRPLPRGPTVEGLGDSGTRTEVGQIPRTLPEQYKEEVAELERQIGKLTEAGNFDDAVVAAESALAIRTREQGKDHWETVDARWRVSTLRSLAARPEEDRRRYPSLQRLQEEGKRLFIAKQLRQGRPMLEKACGIYEQLLGSRHPDTAGCRTYLALAQIASGEFSEGERTSQEAVRVLEELLGKEHPRTARAYLSLGFAAHFQGRLPESLAMANTALLAAQSSFGKSHFATAKYYSFLANNLRLMGRYPEAEEAYRTALQIFRRSSGPESLDAAKATTDLALSYRGQRKYDEALPLYQEVLNIHRKIHGDREPDTIRAQRDLASLCQLMKDHAQASRLYSELVDMSLEVHGEEHAETLRSYKELAWSLMCEKKDDEARPYYEKAHEIQMAHAREDSSKDPAEVYSWLASNLSAQGKEAEAQPFYGKVVVVRRETRKETPAETPPDETAFAYCDLALNLETQGKLPEAQLVREAAIRILRAGLMAAMEPGDFIPPGGPDDFLVADFRHQLGRNLLQQGKYLEAQLHLERPLAIFQGELGGDIAIPEEAAEIGRVLAQCLEGQGKHGETERLLREALAAQEAVMEGAETPILAELCASLARNLDAQGKHEEAFPFHERALQVRRDLFGENHLATLECKTDLARHSILQGKYSDAGKQLEDALRTNETVVGSDHPIRNVVRYQLGCVREAQGRSAEALALWSIAGEAWEKRPGDSSNRKEREQVLREQECFLRLAAGLAHASQAKEAWRWWESFLYRPVSLDGSARTALLQAYKDPRVQKGLDKATRDLRALFLKDGDEAERVRRAKDLAQRAGDQAPIAAILHDLTTTFEVGKLKRLDLPDIQKSLSPTQALVGWLDVSAGVSPGQFAHLKGALVIRATGEPICVEVPGSRPDGAWTPENAALVTGVREALRSEPEEARDDLRQRVEGLSSRLLAPLGPALHKRDGLPEVRHLVVLPSTAVAGVPVRVLTDRHLVTYATSGSLFAQRREQAVAGSPRSRRPGLLAVAGSWEGPPAASAQPPPGLPSKMTLGREVAAVASVFSKTELPRELLKGDGATEMQLRKLARADQLSRYTHLHLAVHIDPASVHPLDSALLLSAKDLPDPADSVAAGQDPFDGKVTASEILGTWHLNADLVALSGCPMTDLPNGNSDGLSALTRALLVSGARSVLIQLWNVAELPKALLLRRLYHNLLGSPSDNKKPMAKADALEEAQRWLRGLTRSEVERELEVLRELAPGGDEYWRSFQLEGAPGDRPFEDPHYWAAFILVGDPG